MDRGLVHQALVQNGAIFADRPPALRIEKINTSNQHTINSASYGPTWRFLRRSLTSGILYSLRVKSYSHSRKWVLQLLKDRLESEFRGSGRICVMNHLQYAMFCLLAVMCLGDKVSEDEIKKIEVAHRRFLSNFMGFIIFSFCPSVTKVVFRNFWKKYLQIRRDQEKN
ncbi:hypothetical protein MANES_13G121150v8 [Manihot esculenta]|uniref:Uncharacterized protein n=1 Tax=Manihot esculenta TaxID=3983 RepID=A0ACB7GMM1_MANES|nr:hypothetical protein MANES_13G121150v8 [Manihot esculenta]